MIRRSALTLANPATALAVSLALVVGAAAANAQGFRAPLHRCDELAGNPIDPLRVGPGVPTFAINAVPAIEACLQALGQYPGEARFQFQLGRAYRQARDYGEAVRWYTLSAKQNVAAAQSNLGLLYGRGAGVRQDSGKAADLFSLGAAQGYEWAQANLGWCYSTGEGRGLDLISAYAWYELAADQGNEPARRNLAALRTKMQTRSILAGRQLADKLKRKIQRGGFDPSDLPPVPAL